MTSGAFDATQASVIFILLLGGQKIEDRVGSGGERTCADNAARPKPCGEDDAEGA